MAEMWLIIRSMEAWGLPTEIGKMIADIEWQRWLKDEGLDLYEDDE